MKGCATQQEAERIAETFRAAYPGEDGVQVDFDHGEWWVTSLTTGAQWVVRDAGSAKSSFEEIYDAE